MRGLIAALAVLCAVGAAPIQDALSCGKQGAAGGLGAGTDMVRYTIDTGRFPEAVCNDGTPAVFYFAPGTERSKWLIFLQGGGSCRDGQSCAERWCSIDTNFGMDKMTSRFSKESIRIDGLLDPESRNRFGSWNRVLLFYCSSDIWSGTKTATLQASAPGGSAIEYEIHFKGRHIIDAVLDTLRNDTRGGKRRAVAAPGTPSPWPDLDEATHVLFAGSSGGGGGVTLNADRVGTKLRAANPGLADYRALIDAAYEPLYELNDFAGSLLCLQDPTGCSYESYFDHYWDQWFSVSGTAGDESCAAWHAPDGTEWRCADGGHVMMHHVTTPFFLRQDLQDNLISNNFAEWGFGTRADYGRRVEMELRGLPQPHEARGAAPGLFVPQCTDHESVTNTRPVFNVFVDGLTFHDTVWNWWSGAGPQQAIRPFSGSPGAAPECP